MRFIVWLTIRLLKNKEIRGEQKTRLISALLENLKAVPVTDIVVVGDDRRLTVDGRTLDMEQAIVFSDSVNGLKHSYARKVINAQLTYKAIQLGIHAGMTPEQIQFSKAVLWVLQEEQALIDSLSGE